MVESDPEFLRVAYRIDVPASAAERRAEALRFEQSVEVPPEVARDPFVQKEILPRVEALGPDPGGGFRAALAFPAHTTAHDPAQLLNLLFGNCSLQDDVTLVGVDLPPSLCAALRGPRLGIGGLRRLAGVAQGPLTCTALKPMGLAPAALAALCGTFARAGIDVIKDDHGLADHAFCPFEARVTACQAALEAAADETGRRAVYAPNLIGPPAAVGRQLDFVRSRGVGAVLLAPMLLGPPLLAELAREAEGVALLAHPAFAGVARIVPEALLGTLFRALGADAVIFPHAGGRFERFDAASCRRLAKNLGAPLHGLRPSLPVPAGGMSIDRVEELVRFYGPDVMLLVGGSLQQTAGGTLLERSRAFVERVRSAGERRAEEGS